MQATATGAATESSSVASDVNCSDPSIDPLEAVFQQWLTASVAIFTKINIWVSPNKKVSIEFLPAIREKNLAALEEGLTQGAVQRKAGVRVIVLDNDIDEYSIASVASPSDSGTEMKKEAKSGNGIGKKSAGAEKAAPVSTTSNKMKGSANTKSNDNKGASDKSIENDSIFSVTSRAGQER